MIKLLILGGTTEARTLANVVCDTVPGTQVTTSLAGRTRAPKTLAGEVRIGGFGGAEGLADYVRAHNITHIIDATHPFAATISKHAVAAARQTGTALLRLTRPEWRAQKGDRWRHVPDIHHAAVDVATRGERLFANHRRQ